MQTPSKEFRMKDSVLQESTLNVLKAGKMASVYTKDTIACKGMLDL